MANWIRYSWTCTRPVTTQPIKSDNSTCGHNAMPVATKLITVVAYREELPYINLNDPLIIWSCEVTWQIKYISIFRRLMGTKLGEVRTYCYRLPPLRSHDPLIRWLTWDQMMNWRYISTFTRLVVKLGRVLSLDKISRMRTLKLSPTVYFRYLFNISFFILGGTYLHAIKNYKLLQAFVFLIFSVTRKD